MTAANIALPKYGLDNGPSTAAILQIWFGAGPLFKKAIRNIQPFVFNLAFPPGGRFPNIRTSAMQTVNSKHKIQSLRVEVFRSAKYFFIRFFGNRMLDQPMLTNCICFYGQCVCGQRKAY